MGNILEWDLQKEDDQDDLRNVLYVKILWDVAFGFIRNSENDSLRERYNLVYNSLKSNSGKASSGKTGLEYSPRK